MKRVAMAAACVLGACVPALGLPEYLDAFEARYPGTTLLQRMASTFGSQCYMCHLPEDFSAEGTCYRLAIRDRLDAGLSIQQALAAIEPLDSDGDGVSNLDEILTPRADLAGQVGYHPGRVGPLGVSPCPGGPGFIGSGVPETPPCAGDANGDRQVNGADLSVLLGQFGTVTAPGTGADFNGDGQVNSADLSTLLARFGQNC